MCTQNNPFDGPVVVKQKFVATFNPWHRKQHWDGLIVLITNEMSVFLKHQSQRYTIRYIHQWNSNDFLHDEWLTKHICRLSNSASSFAPFVTSVWSHLLKPQYYFLPSSFFLSFSLFFFFHHFSRFFVIPPLVCHKSQIQFILCASFISFNRFEPVCHSAALYDK